MSKLFYYKDLTKVQWNVFKAILWILRVGDRHISVIGTVCITHSFVLIN